MELVTQVLLGFDGVFLGVVMTKICAFLTAFFVISLAAGVGSAQSRSSEPSRDETAHRLELVAEGGLAWPPSGTPSEPSNLDRGTTAVGSLLMYIGRGWSLGVAVDWRRMPWTPQAGPKAHVNAYVVGPEIRHTFNRRHWLLPHVYFGVGGQTIASSRQSPTESISGNLTLRTGLGLDFRVAPAFRVGLSGGVVTGGTSSSGIDMYVPGDPGIPDNAGTAWTLRLGCRAELF